LSRTTSRPRPDRGRGRRRRWQHLSPAPASRLRAQPQRCTCDIETGHRSTTAALVANIAHKTKAYLEWDAQGERFTNNADANRHLACRYRAPLELPNA
jgi:hypothetical protein